MLEFETTTLLRGDAAAGSAAASRNVRRVYAEAGLFALSSRLWQMQLLSMYLFALKPDARFVGLAEGVQGVARLVAFCVVGPMVDRCPRQRLLRAAAAFGLLVHGAAAALLLRDEPPLQEWLAVLGAFAVYATLQQSLADSVFADCVASGDRVRPYTVYGVVRQASMLFSPLAQMGVFGGRDENNRWTQEALQPALLSGVALGALSCCVLGSLNAKAALGAASDALGSDGNGRAVAAAAESAPSPAAPAGRCAATSAASIRWTIFAFDTLRVLSGGLVIKYVGLHFSSALGLTPLGLARVELGGFCSMITLTLLAGWLSDPAKGALPRGTVCIGLLLVCDASNFVVATVPACGVAGAGGAWALREGTLNAVFALKKSILMDHTPKGARGRWNAVESLQVAIWSGAAVVSGLVIHDFGYAVVFWAMAVGFVAATLVWVPLRTIR